MDSHLISTLAVALTLGLPACSLYDADMTAAWESPPPAVLPELTDEESAPASATLFAHPADEEAAALLAMEREPIPILEPTLIEIETEPQPLAPAIISAIPIPEPPMVAQEISQPPVIVAGSGMPDPGSIDGPPSDPEVAEILTETLVPEANAPFEMMTLTLDPVIDSPPSLDYGVKLSEESTPIRMK